MDYNKNFDPVREAHHISGWIRSWFRTNGPTATAVIGISGGKDSTIAAKFAVDALGEDRVFGILMPNGVQTDIDDAVRVVELLNIPYSQVDIEAAVDAMMHCIKSVSRFPTKRSPWNIGKDTEINLPPRVRMSLLYGVMPSNGFVINTCNLSEDYIGYSTKHGDSAGDLSPLGEYTVTEIRRIGLEALRLPEDLVLKTPSDGLCGKTDEEKIGFSYEVLDRYIRTGICEDPKTKDMIDSMHRRNLHKLKPIPTCRPVEP